MDKFLYNFNFIWFNSFLALIAVFFGYLMLKTKSGFLKTLYGFLWLVFLPNTIYIVTDFTHLVEDWHTVDFLFKFVLAIQYGLFALTGIVTFIFSVYFFERLLEGSSRKKKTKARKKNTLATALIISMLNFLVGFGVILGGIQRTNSWYIFSQPLKVTNDIFLTLQSKELIFLSLGFGLLSNLIYFYFADPLINWCKKHL